MFIHIGDGVFISDRTCIGIFSSETIRLSANNEWLINKLNNEDKTVVININNDVLTSKVSPYTIIKRTSLKKDIVWRRNNE